jgi:hypothetical protein
VTKEYKKDKIPEKMAMKRFPGFLYTVYCKALETVHVSSL